MANGMNHQWTAMYGNGYQAPGVDNSQYYSYKPDTHVQTLEIDDKSPLRKQTFRQRYFGGLKRTLTAFVIVAAAVLIVNLAWLIHAKATYGIINGYGTIRQGECDSVKQLNIWLHLLINILSTLLLVGSNAFMAAYSSPTRQEINAAHFRRKWVHVGFMSFRNMKWISKRKSFIVIVLALSSLPFHLLYNSLVFMETAVNNYNWAVVTEDFLNNTLPNVSMNNSAQPGDIDSFQVYLENIKANVSTWERLDNKACLQAYGNAFVSTRRTVLLISSTKNDTNSVLESGLAEFTKVDGEINSNWWICSESFNDGGSMTCNAESYVANAASWTVDGYPVEYCLSERTEGICSVKFSLSIMYAMVAFNSLKLGVMAWILWRFDASHIIACVGDAASSFIQDPDPTTAGMCLANRRRIDNFWRSQGMAKMWLGQHRDHWGQALSKKRWIIFYLLMILSICIVLFFGIWGFSHVKDEGYSLTASSLWSLGFGTPDEHTIVVYDANVNTIGIAMLANTPQVFMALIWLIYMGIMTSMFIAADWAQFAAKGEYLMVSSPAGKQRGTWLFGVPWGYGILFLILQTLLHWFVSQSIFLVQVVVFDETGQRDTSLPPSDNASYSPVAIIFSVVTGVLLCISTLIFMFRRFPAGSPPVVSTCSAAISAACHVSQSTFTSASNEDLPFYKFRWGVSANAGPYGVAHCSLDIEEPNKPGYLGPPVHGWGYA